MTLNDVIAAFAQFDFTEGEVRGALAVGDSAHNAFESLKIQLQIRWEDMRSRLTAERLEVLGSVYAKIQKLNMKSRKTAADKKAEQEARVEAAVDNLTARVAARKRKNLQVILGSVEAQVEDMKRRGEWTPEAEERLRFLMDALPDVVPKN